MTRRWKKALLFALLAASAAALAQLQPPQAAAEETKTAVFAGGCFWCVEEAFEKVDGVTDATSGYTGGKTANPTYQQVSAGRTGHAEAVRVRFDPAKVTYETLLDVFWRNIDPFDAGGQFCDRGDSYRSAIFTADEEQKRLAEASKVEIAGILKRPVKIATEIAPLTTFYPAEGYHQNYYVENPVRYKFYKWNCGRAQRLEQIWGPPKS